jgi:hypothetical protein
MNLARRSALCALWFRWLSSPSCALRFCGVRFAMRYALCAMLLLVSWVGEAKSQGLLQGVSGYFDVNFNTSSTKSTDSSGNTTKSDSMIYNPRFSLNVNTQIFPNLLLAAGGLVEGNVSESTTDGVKSKSKGANFRPYINLMLNVAPFNFGVGYNRREEYAKAGDGPTVGNINEEYTGVFGWKPDRLPTVDILFSRRNFFDKDREFQDTTSDSILFGSKYAYKNLDVKYQASYSDQTLKLVGLETTDLTQTARVTYSDSLFDRRVSFNTSYNVTRQDSTTTANGTGLVSSQLFPFAGLSAITDTPLLIELVPNPALIDGSQTAGAGIDIGLPPVGGNTKPRNIGIDLLNITEVNNLLIWVDKELPLNIANFFSWDIYTSSDNLNWVFFRTISPAPFGFQFQNRFELDFPPVKTRYIKVVTRPLAPAVLDAAKFPNIFITEIQGFSKKSVQDVKTKTHNMSQFFNFDAKARILNIPSFFYDFSSFYSRSDPSGVYQYTLSNGLSVNHRFNQVFSGTARVAREDGVQQSRKVTDYVYNAALMASPLKTLTHTLVFSGRNGTTEEGSSSSNSVFLNNTANLYQGIDVYLNGGVNSGKRETDEKQFGTTVSFGSNIVPHRNLSFNFNISNTTSKQSGGGKPDNSTYANTGDFSLSFTPFRTLYFFGSLSVASRKDAKTSFLQNYSVGWSPFSGGSLQLNVGYSESLRSEDNGRDRSMGPSLTWKITNRAALNMSYQVVRSESLSQKAEGNSFSSRLQILF